MYNFLIVIQILISYNFYFDFSNTDSDYFFTLIISFYHSNFIFSDYDFDLFFDSDFDFFFDSDSEFSDSDSDFSDSDSDFSDSDSDFSDFDLIGKRFV